MSTVIIWHPERCQPRQSEYSQLTFDSLVLRAGVNPLSEPELLALKKHPDLSRYMKLGAIEFVDSAEFVDPTINVEIIELSAYAVEDAQKIILETFDLNALNTWLLKETRKTVRSTISTRIEQLRAGTL
jgi:hypothetical protein